ncbi:hypothetical protein SF23_00060 [Streptomyces sp. MBRL 10]|nr:hypothetical protein SF23_00060 [Streptomyces sp. MBRL 10]
MVLRRDPFKFLEGPVGSVAGAMSNIAAPFLGLVGALGGIYLGVKNWGPHGRVTAVLKGFGWMTLIAGLFFWFAANPTAAGSKINTIVGEVTATGFESLAKLPTTGGAEGTALCNGKYGTDAAGCVQDAVWVPLVYQPWLYGQVGNSGPAADRWGAEMLNAQFVGVDAEGKIDEDGIKVITNIVKWNGTDNEVGTSSKSGNLAWEGQFVNTVPYLKLWGNGLCKEGGDHNFRLCWGDKDTGWFSNDKHRVLPEDEPIVAIAGGNDFMSRLSAAAMSVMGGMIINASIYFICAMLLAAKLGVFVLMIFAPFYLLLGIFPGPSRVAAIKLGELFLTNLFRQVGWGLGLVIVTYMDTLILAPGGDQNWVLKMLTCALMTALLGVYARPAMRALSGMAVGNKDAGDAIVGVGADLAKKAAQTTLQVGAAVATGGATAAMSAGAAVKGASAAASASGQTLSTSEKFQAAGMGVLRNAPNLGKRTRSLLGKFGDAKDAGKETYEKGQEREDQAQTTETISKSSAAREGLVMQRRQRTQEAPHQAAMAAIKQRRFEGDEEGAAAMEREHFDALRDPRTGGRHPEDPMHPSNLRRNPTGGSTRCATCARPNGATICSSRSACRRSSLGQPRQGARDVPEPCEHRPEPRRRRRPSEPRSPGGLRWSAHRCGTVRRFPGGRPARRPGPHRRGGSAFQHPGERGSGGAGGQRDSGPAVPCGHGTPGADGGPEPGRVAGAADTRRHGDVHGSQRSPRGPGQHEGAPGADRQRTPGRPARGRPRMRR